MRLIIGGAYQGKLDYAIKNYNISESEVANGKELDINVLSHIKCINNYHLTVKKLIENGENPISITDEILAANPDIVIILNEIGNGIVSRQKMDCHGMERIVCQKSRHA